ncbi:hypothetical protein HZU75_01695 [Chitinibacter fontanus]|uniref:DUF697 domain-containing protein n=1 Tax=Chitinibacter fontanus TaxID=1737446 RepID=A0A7D5ZD78_9NEIS|nr:hypothetical protein [Chitinibacter fontanus]QLI80348.1 hypothetical protein HZU75_01695 [Chitinibacter fontanus]
MKMTMTELEAIRQECRDLVNQRSLISAAAAAVPIPGLDVGADVAIMTRMIALINEKFHLGEQDLAQLDDGTRRKLLVIISSIGSSLIGRYASKELIILALKRVGVRMVSKQAAKFIPILGMVVAATISFGAMRILGNAHIEDCYQVLKRQIEDNEKIVAEQ